jgi:NarL family two-component system sensor histidine kinase LiaS
MEEDLYYVLREGLMNIARHSQASRADIVLTQMGGEIRGAVKDDGVGFDLNQTGNGQGLGLSTMRARIKRVGGELDIESAPGRGAKISFVLPVMAEAA